MRDQQIDLENNTRGNFGLLNQEHYAIFERRIYYISYSNWWALYVMLPEHFGQVLAVGSGSNKSLVDIEQGLWFLKWNSCSVWHAGKEEISWMKSGGEERGESLRAEHSVGVS